MLFLVILCLQSTPILSYLYLTMRDNFKDSTSEMHIDDVCDAVQITETSMNALYDLLLSPVTEAEPFENHNGEQCITIKALDNDAFECISLIGLTLQLVAKKARAYEQTFEKGELGLPENFQN
jgi:hypothetical protein